MMQRKSTPLSRLLMALLGSTLLGVSAVAISQTDPDPAPMTNEPIAAEPLAPEPSGQEPATPEPAAPAAEPAVAQPEPITPPYNVATPPTAPEAITATAQLNETDYQRIFEDMDANRNGFIEPPEYRPGALPDTVISRISHERQMARTDGRNEGGYEAPSSPRSLYR